MNDMSVLKSPLSATMPPSALSAINSIDTPNSVITDLPPLSASQLEEDNHEEEDDQWAFLNKYK